MKKCLFVFVLFVCTRHAQAQLVTFTDRPTWQANTSSSTVENFNSFVTEDGFGVFAFPPPPLDVGDFSLSLNNGNNFGYIDIPGVGTDVPFDAIDGTTYAIMGLATDQSLFIDFDSPVTAFGADFRDFNEPGGISDIEVNSTLLGVPQAPDGALRFFGLTSTVPFTQVEIRGFSVGDQFGMDNVSYGIAAVPGDFNSNGVVDGYDFLKWQRGESPDPLSTEDYEAWEENFGPAAPAFAAVVPEPTSLVLVGLAGLICGGRRRR